MAEKQAEKVRSLRDEFPDSVPVTASGGETFKWDKIGKRLRGRFIRLRDGSLGGQMALIDTGSRVETASAPVVLAEALESVKPGSEVVIQYMGDQPNKKDPKRRTANFEVVVL